MKRKIIVSTLCFICFYLFFFIFCINVSASENQKYKISNVNFDVNLQENGDAIITENWTVHYIHGNFTQFYKNVNTNVYTLERFEDISILSCTIDGEEAFEVDNDKNRETNTYYFEIGKKIDTIHWFKPITTENVTVEYQVQYLLKNIVKQVDNSSIFKYTFITDEFETKIGQTQTNIHFPNTSSSFIVDTSSDADYVIKDNNTIIINQQNVKDKIVYKISTDADIFKKLKIVTKEEVIADEEFENQVSKFYKMGFLFENLKKFYIIGCGIFLFLLPIITIIFVKKTNNVKMKNIEQLKNETEKFLFGFEIENIHPLELVFIDKISNSQFLIGILFELCRRQEVYFTENELIISKNIHYIHPMEEETINCILQEVNSLNTETYYIIPMVQCFDMLGKSFDRKITIIKTDVKQQFAKEKLNYIHKKLTPYFKIMNYEKLTIDGCIEQIMNTKTIEYSKIIYFVSRYRSSKTIYSKENTFNHRNNGSGNGSHSSSGGSHGGGAN